MEAAAAGPAGHGCAGNRDPAAVPFAKASRISEIQNPDLASPSHWTEGFGVNDVPRAWRRVFVAGFVCGPRARAERRSVGAGGQTRTADLLITNQLLYRLSYSGALRDYTGWSDRLRIVRRFVECAGGHSGGADADRSGS